MDLSRIVIHGQDLTDDDLEKLAKLNFLLKLKDIAGIFIKNDIFVDQALEILTNPLNYDPRFSSTGQKRICAKYSRLDTIGFIKGHKINVHRQFL